MRINNENSLRKNEPSSMGHDNTRNSTVEPIQENNYEQESDFR
jgi:hypothetical protein